MSLIRSTPVHGPAVLIEPQVDDEVAHISRMLALPAAPAVPAVPAAPAVPAVAWLEP